MSQCATTNCEDESHKDDFAYCGKGHCSSCGGGCGDDDCSKCNRQAKWVSKKASNDRAFSTGWSVIKGGVKNWLHDMVYEVKGLVENQQINPMEAARFVAEQNDPNDRQLGRLLFKEYIRMTNEDLL